jgi:hypothetical protein
MKQYYMELYCCWWGGGDSDYYVSVEDYMETFFENVGNFWINRKSWMRSALLISHTSLFKRFLYSEAKTTHMIVIGMLSIILLRPTLCANPTAAACGVLRTLTTHPHSACEVVTQTSRPMCTLAHLLVGQKHSSQAKI